jgi:hypothetical protein
VERSKKSVVMGNKSEKDETIKGQDLSSSNGCKRYRRSSKMF